MQKKVGIGREYVEYALQKINCLNNGKESLEPGLRISLISFSSPFHQGC